LIEGIVFHHNQGRQIMGIFQVVAHTPPIPDKFLKTYVLWALELDFPE